MASSSIVIKVKYGETLRRISPSIHDSKLSLDIFMLKEKIRGLFGFAPGSVFNMTYEDEDGDIVTLATDDDIRDVMQQALNPLRITVKLSYAGNSNPGGSNNGGTSAPMRLPQNSLQQLQVLQCQQQLLLQQLIQCQQRPQLLQQHLLPRQQQLLQAQIQTSNSGVSSAPVLLEPLPHHPDQSSQSVLGNAIANWKTGSTNSF